MPLPGTESTVRDCRPRGILGLAIFFLWIAASPSWGALGRQAPPVAEDDLQAVRALEQARCAVIDRVIGSVIAIYGDDREGGGSGVIIDPSGIALTNHHVIQAAGVEGWGGLADGKLYRWKIIGSDPGGDIALIQMEGRGDFPSAPLGDSDRVRVGDWAFAMGNPFVLSEDETPTVTMGIVSGVNRFQEGAGSNQLVYGNCIQVDSSINPGNSGGPLFNMAGEVIGINGRGSFEDRGRVNVGLGYAISSNQIKNFVPDLLATKIVEHGTLDATFDLRDDKVVCASLVEDSAAHQAGLELGDRLLQFERQSIHSVNQYLNLICTLPEGWLAELVVEKADGSQRTIQVPLYGLPYNINAPQTPEPSPEPNQKPTPEQQRAIERQKKMIAFMSTPPGTIRDAKLNGRFATWLERQWRRDARVEEDAPPRMAHLKDRLYRDDKLVGQQELWLATDGRFELHWQDDQIDVDYGFDGTNFWREADGDVKTLTVIEAKTSAPVIQAMTLVAAHQAQPFAPFGARTLDGSGKAQDQLAYRIKVLDAKQDWFYCWLSMFDRTGRPHVAPLKVSSDLHEATRGVSVTFADWTDHDGLLLADRRAVVRGLDDRVDVDIRLESCEVRSPIDDTRFRQPLSGERRP